MPVGSTLVDEAKEESFTEMALQDQEAMTCDALRSLAGPAASAPQSTSSSVATCPDTAKKQKSSKSCAKSCSKQLQLPMFLSSEYAVRI